MPLPIDATDLDRDLHLILFKKVPRLEIPIIPCSKNLSEFGTDGMNEIGSIVDENIENDKYAVEEEIISMMKILNSQEKIMFLFQILRGDGYHLKYERCAEVIDDKPKTRSWYMQILKKMKIKLNEFNNKSGV